MNLALTQPDDCREGKSAHIKQRKSFMIRARAEGRADPPVEHLTEGKGNACDLHEDETMQRIRG